MKRPPGRPARPYVRVAPRYDPATLAQRLEAAMGTTSAYELSRRTRVAWSTIRRLREGGSKVGPDAYTLVLLADALRVSVDYLLGRDDGQAA